MAYRRNLWKYVKGVQNWDAIVREFALQMDDPSLIKDIYRNRFTHVDDVELSRISDNVKEEYKPKLRSQWDEAWEGVQTAAIKFATYPKLEDAIEFIREGFIIGVLSKEESEELNSNLCSDWQVARDNRTQNWTHQITAEAKQS